MCGMILAPIWTDERLENQKFINLIFGHYWTIRITVPKEGSRPISTYLAFTKKVRMFTLEVLQRNFEIFDLFSTTAFSRNIFEASYVLPKIYRENVEVVKKTVERRKIS